jgi:hypothetical protein
MAGFVNPGSVKAGGFTEMTELGHVHRVGRRLIVGARAPKDRDDPEIGNVASASATRSLSGST